MNRVHIWSVQNRPEPILAPINTWIGSSPLPDPLDECRRLIGAHRPSWVMPIFLEIQNQEHAGRTRSCASTGPCRRDNRQKVIGLPNGIGRVAKMVCAPKKAGAGRVLLAETVLGIPVKTRECRFVNDSDYALGFHGAEFRSHEVVVGRGHVDHANYCRKQQPEKGRRRREKTFHRTEMRINGVAVHSTRTDWRRKLAVAFFENASPTRGGRAPRAPPMAPRHRISEIETRIAFRRGAGSGVRGGRPPLTIAPQERAAASYLTRGITLILPSSSSMAHRTSSTSAQPASRSALINSCLVNLDFTSACSNSRPL